MNNSSNDYFHLKGKNAEKLIHDLAQTTFLADWCYLNPLLPDGKELCDLLIVFDDVAIIWQIKDLKLDNSGKYKQSELTKNLRQLTGARRQLFVLKKPIRLNNPRRGEELFDSALIKEVYLISALLGEGEEAFSFVETIKEHTIHVFSRDFTEIILNELNTISDFTKYLAEKEETIEGKEFIIMGGEEELLAKYLIGNKSFEEFKQADLVIIEMDFWSKFQSSEEYKEKQKLDEISYGWDYIINRAHEASPGYEKVARELARPNRFERRVLGKTYYEVYVQAAEDTLHDLVRRTFGLNGVTYCFLFADDSRPREYRIDMLKSLCFVARGLYKENPKVIGIATEKKASPTCSYDYVLLNIPEWTEDNQKDMERIKKELNILNNPIITVAHEDEYSQIKKED